jgi:hypothetical protein
MSLVTSSEQPTAKCQSTDLCASAINVVQSSNVTHTHLSCHSSQTIDGKPQDDLSATVVTDHPNCDDTITLDRHNMIRAHLPSKESLIVLMDSGASSSLVGAATVESSKFLSALPKRKVPTLRFKVGNGQYIYTMYAIEIPLIIGEHKFVIEARAVANLGGIDLVVGTQALEDIDAKLDFQSHRLKFNKSSIMLHTRQNFVLPPKQSKVVQLTGRLPNFLKNSQALIRTTSFTSKFTGPLSLVKFKNGVTQRPVWLLSTNSSHLLSFASVILQIFICH